MPNRIATLLALALALALASSPATVLADQVKPDDLDQRVRCAAIFALLARDQNKKLPEAAAYPPVEEKGKAFFMATGLRLFAERKVDASTVRTFFQGEVDKFQGEVVAAKDPRAHFDTAFRSCQHYLAEVAPAPAG